MTEQALEAKFMDQADIGGIDVRSAERALESLKNLEQVEDVATIITLLVPAS